jgi:hypothetical protein
MILQRDLTPAIPQQARTSDFNEAYTIIHVNPHSGVDYWMLLDYGTRAEHRIDYHIDEDTSWRQNIFATYQYRPAGFTHEGTSGPDGQVWYFQTLSTLVDHMNGQA